MSTTQYVVIGVFIFFIIVAVIVFATYGGSGGEKQVPLAITLWGTVPSDYIRDLSDLINTARPNSLDMIYVEKSPLTFESELTEALAEGRGPDAIIVSEKMILKQKNKLALIPFEYFSERSLKDTFIEAGEVFITNTGTYALPFIVDPLVMYWNRDLFSAASISIPPVYWDQMPDVAKKLTKLSPSKTVLKSAIAFGEYRNVNNAGAILSALTLQAGSRFVIWQDGVAVNVLTDNTSGTNKNALELALIFFTQFADPSNEMYSWNRSLPNSLNAFVAGDLGIYMGFASEIQSIQSRNPNLNFDVALLPQVRDSDSKITYADVYGLAVLASSPKKVDAVNTFTLLTSAPAIEKYSSISGLPPVRRDLLSVSPGQAAKEVFWNSAIWSRTWLDPNPNLTSKYMQNMVESVVSGELEADNSADSFAQQLDEILTSFK